MFNRRQCFKFLVLQSRYVAILTSSLTNINILYAIKNYSELEKNFSSYCQSQIDRRSWKNQIVSCFLLELLQTRQFAFDFWFTNITCSLIIIIPLSQALHSKKEFILYVCHKWIVNCFDFWGMIAEIVQCRRLPVTKVT